MLVETTTPAFRLCLQFNAPSLPDKVPMEKADKEDTENCKDTDNKETDTTGTGTNVMQVT